MRAEILSNPDKVYALVTGMLRAGVLCAAIHLNSSLEHLTDEGALRDSVSLVAGDLNDLDAMVREAIEYRDKLGV